MGLTADIRRATSSSKKDDDCCGLKDRLQAGTGSAKSDRQRTISATVRHVQYKNVHIGTNTVAAKLAAVDSSSCRYKSVRGDVGGLGGV